MSQIEVTVEGGVVRVDVEHLKMGKQKQATIKWKLKTAGCIFPSDGIVIEGNDGQFSNFQVSDAGTTFSCVDANTNNKEYKYDVKVKQGDATLILDPTITNEGGP